MFELLVIDFENLFAYPITESAGDVRLNHYRFEKKQNNTNYLRFALYIFSQIIALATLNDENLFYFYDNLENLSGEPHLYHVEFEDNLLVSEEVYSRLAFSNPKLR